MAIINSSAQSDVRINSVLALPQRAARHSSFCPLHAGLVTPAYLLRSAKLPQARPSAAISLLQSPLSAREILIHGFPGYLRAHLTDMCPARLWWRILRVVCT